MTGPRLTVPIEHARVNKRERRMPYLLALAIVVGALMVARAL